MRNIEGNIHINVIYKYKMLVYPNGLYQYILATCAIHSQHIYIGYKYGKYHCALMGVTLFGTSVCYWYYPLTNCWRRNVDMFVAHSTIAYHGYLAVAQTSNPLLCGSIILSGASMYPLSIWLIKNKYHQGWGVLCHCLLHILTSIGASVTYAHM
jgi:hypothetical protein